MKKEKDKDKDQIKYEESEDPNASFCLVSKMYF
jgi:hypothetical protein